MRPQSVHRIRGDGKEETWAVLACVDVFTEHNVGHGVWLLPAASNQGGFDAVQIESTEKGSGCQKKASVRFVNVTKADRHTLNLAPVRSMLVRLVELGVTQARVDFVFLHPHGKPQPTVRNPTSQTLADWGWSPAQVRFCAFHRST